MLCVDAVVLNIALCVLFLCLHLTIVYCSIIITDGVDIELIWGFGCVIDLVWCALLLMVYSVTLELVGSCAVVAGVAELVVLCCIACYVV